MTGFLTSLLTVSISMSAVILLLMLLNKLLLGKVSAKFRYYAWIIVLIGLFIPFRPSLPFFFGQIRIPLSFDGYLLDSSTGGLQNELQNQETEINSIPSITTVYSQKPQASYALIIYWVWISGALLILAFHIRSYAKFILAIRRWGVEISDDNVLSVIKSVYDDMGIKPNHVKVKICAFISSPILLGFSKPIIVLPESPISSDELEFIFKHELTHYKRKDLWINLFVLIISAMHWFNPLVHVMAKFIRADCEAACDEAVVAGICADKRRHYGETIIGFIGAKSSIRPVLSTYFYGGSNSMKKRLFSIMDTSRKSKTLSVVCAALITVATLLSGNVFALAAADSTDKYIGVDKAKSIALEHAGITQEQATFIKAYLDYDDGYVVYDIEFYSGDTEHDYEINAINGNIIEFDRDIEYYTIPKAPIERNKISWQPLQKNNAEQTITEDEAKAIALSAAGLSESQVRKIKVERERENGVIVYEVEFNHGRLEYEYEINAVSGAIIKSDVDYDD